MDLYGFGAVSCVLSSSISVFLLPRRRAKALQLRLVLYFNGGKADTTKTQSELVKAGRQKKALAAKAKAYSTESAAKNFGKKVTSFQTQSKMARQ